jgi:Domain of unknown function (DUF5010)
MKKFLAMLACFAVVSGTFGTVRGIPPAFGRHVNLTAKDFAESTSFASTNKIVGTYYFYWYDSYSGSHIRNPDGTDALTTHPPTLEDFSYKSVRWHKKQLADMETAGIDVALMVFWGSPAEHATNTDLHWSFAGLPPLVQAREELLREGRKPPRIGLFYDTSTLQYNNWHYHADLTTDFGKKFFYATVRDFYSCIPPKHWAMLDGKPIVLMYASAFAAKWDQSFVDYTKTEFAKEFGGRLPWIAPQDAWSVKGDNTCAWGGALAFHNPGIGELGPGYDHSAVPGRTPLVREREGGKFYEESWLKFLRRPSNFVMIETWNEFHEGTDIAESKEYGRQYIELTRKFSDLFKRGWKPPRPQGKFTNAKSVSIQLTAKNVESGLSQIECEDGITTPANEAGYEARRVKPFRQNSRYMYFAVDDSFKWTDTMDATLEVQYFDASKGSLHVEFDGSDPAAPFNGAYSRSANDVALTGDKSRKTARFELRGARFLNSQNGGADFRLTGETTELVVGRVTLERR